MNAVGSYQPNTRELETTVIKRANIIVDTEEAFGAGDLAYPSSEGIAVKGQTLASLLFSYEDRSTVHLDPSKDLTLFKSVGTAVQDVMTANLALQKCLELKLGQEFEL